MKSNRNPDFAVGKNGRIANERNQHSNNRAPNNKPMVPQSDIYKTNPSKRASSDSPFGH